MAKLKPGPFGHPIGRIGNTVFYVLNGQGLCRNIGEQNNPATPKQKGNRQELKLTMDLLKPLQRFIKLGFEHQAKGTVYNPFNIATSYNKLNAIQGAYPNLSVDYAKVKLSSGTLPLAKDLQISKTADGVKVSWDGTHAWAGDQYDDLVMIALYHPKHKKASLFLNAGKRNEGECVVHLEDDNWLNEPIEAYLTFKSADGTSVSESVYLGNLNGNQEQQAKQKIDEEYTKVKARLEKVKANYDKLDALFQKTGLRTKSFKATKKEYEVLKDKLEHLPGKPV